MRIYEQLIKKKDRVRRNLVAQDLYIRACSAGEKFASFDEELDALSTARTEYLLNDRGIRSFLCAYIVIHSFLRQSKEKSVELIAMQDNNRGSQKAVEALKTDVRLSKLYAHELGQRLANELAKYDYFRPIFLNATAYEADVSEDFRHELPYELLRPLYEDIISQFEKRPVTLGDAAFQAWSKFEDYFFYPDKQDKPLTELGAFFREITESDDNSLANQIFHNLAESLAAKPASHLNGTCLLTVALRMYHVYDDSFRRFFTHFQMSEKIRAVSPELKTLHEQPASTYKARIEGQYKILASSLRGWEDKLAEIFQDERNYTANVSVEWRKCFPFELLRMLYDKIFVKIVHPSPPTAETSKVAWQSHEAHCVWADFANYVVGKAK